MREKTIIINYAHQQFHENVSSPIKSKDERITCLTRVKQPQQITGPFRNQINRISYTLEHRLHRVTSRVSK